MPSCCTAASCGDGASVGGGDSSCGACRQCIPPGAGSRSCLNGGTTQASQLVVPVRSWPGGCTLASFSAVVLPASPCPIERHYAAPSKVRLALDLGQKAQTAGLIYPVPGLPFGGTASPFLPVEPFLPLSSYEDSVQAASWVELGFSWLALVSILLRAVVLASLPSISSADSCTGSAPFGCCPAPSSPSICNFTCTSMFPLITRMPRDLRPPLSVFLPIEPSLQGFPTKTTGREKGKDAAGPVQAPS